jgi:hypothetical protein
MPESRTSHLPLNRARTSHNGLSSATIVRNEPRSGHVVPDRKLMRGTEAASKVARGQRCACVVRLLVVVPDPHITSYTSKPHFSKQHIAAKMPSGMGCTY